MKKFFAVIMLFTVLVSGAFAEFDFGGLVGAGSTLLKGSNVRGDPLQAGNYLSGYIEASGQDNADRFGAAVRINAEASTDDPNAWGWGASAWWKPLYFAKIQLGHIDDFALTEIVGWGFHANDAEDFVVSPRLNYAGDYFSNATGFYAGTGNGWTGIALSASPLYGLDLHVALPFGRGEEQRDRDGKLLQKYQAKDVYEYIHGQVAYTFWGLGRFAVSYEGGGNGKLYLAYSTGDPTDPDDPDNIPGLEDPNNPDPSDPYGGDPYGDDPSFRFNQLEAKASTLHTSFLFNRYEDRGLIVNLGFSYTLPVSTYDPSKRKITYYSPMEIGLGISIGTDRLGIKARMAASFNGRAERTGSPVLHEPLMLGLGLLPFISYGPFKFHLNTGISYKFADEYMLNDGSNRIQKIGNSAALGWYVNPYMTFTAGPGRFYVGFQAQCDGLKYQFTKQLDKQSIKDLENGAYKGTTMIEWGIPIGIMVEF